MVEVEALLLETVGGLREEGVEFMAGAADGVEVLVACIVQVQILSFDRVEDLCRSGAWQFNAFGDL